MKITLNSIYLKKNVSCRIILIKIIKFQNFIYIYTIIQYISKEKNLEFFK